VRIALISDDLTRVSLELEEGVKVFNVTPYNYKMVLQFAKPDLLFVESAWNGFLNSWKYKIASYPGYKNRSNKALKKVVNYAKSLGIPTLFWNKEDDVHHSRFKDSAVLCDYIFTVDVNSIPKYEAETGNPAYLLMFAVQPKIHSFSGFNFRYKKANFVGSYTRVMHTQRRQWQDMYFNTLCEMGFGVDVYNRNSNRTKKIYGYPKLECLREYEKVSFTKTAQIYKDYMISLNVNTITDSITMFSRRLVEIIACGGVCITNPSLSVETLFKDYCFMVSSKEEFKEAVGKILTDGLGKRELEKIKEGANYVLSRHTWTKRLEDIAHILGIESFDKISKTKAVNDYQKTF